MNVVNAFNVAANCQ